MSSAVRNGHRLIGVVLGGTTSAARDRAMMRLLDTAFAEEDQSVRVASFVPDRAAKPANLAEFKPANAVASPKPQPIAVASAPAPVAAAPAPVSATSVLAPVPVSAVPTPAVATAAAPAASSSDEAADDSRDIGWGVQVGAYGRYTLANAAALKTKRGMHELATTTISVTRMRVGGVTLYRARLIGLSEREARAVCADLHRHKSQCMLVVPSSDRSIAQVSQ